MQPIETTIGTGSGGASRRELPYDGCFINLEESRDRRLELEAHLGKLGLADHYQRVEAVDGGEAHTRYDTPLTPARLGCWLSHQRVLERYQGTTRPLHILEDDAVLDARLPRVFQAISAEVEWDVILTDVFFHPPPPPEQFVGLVRMLKRFDEQKEIKLVDLKTIRFTGTTSYFVSPRAVSRLHGLLEGHWTRGYGHDIAIQKLVAAGALRAYVTIPFLSTESRLATESTIGGHGSALQALAALRRAFFIGTDRTTLPQTPTPAGSERTSPLLSMYLSVLEAVLDPLVR